MWGRCFLLVPRGVCSDGSSAFLTKLPHTEEVPINTWCVNVVCRICHGMSPACRQCLGHRRTGWRLAFYLVQMSEVLGVLVGFCSVNWQRTSSCQSNRTCIFNFYTNLHVGFWAWPYHHIPCLQSVHGIMVVLLPWIEKKLILLSCFFSY